MFIGAALGAQRGRFRDCRSVAAWLVHVCDCENKYFFCDLMESSDSKNTGLHMGRSRPMYMYAS